MSCFLTCKAFLLLCFLLCRFLGSFHRVQPPSDFLPVRSKILFTKKKITKGRWNTNESPSTLSTTCCCVYRLVSFSPFYKFFFTLDCSVEWKASSSSFYCVFFWYCSRSGLSGRTFPEITQLQRPVRRIYEDDDKQKIPKKKWTNFFFFRPALFWRSSVWWRFGNKTRSHALMTIAFSHTQTDSFGLHVSFPPQNS